MEWYKHLYEKKFIDFVGFKPKNETLKEIIFVLNKLKLSENSKLLDLCCGYGRHSYAIARKMNIEVTGIDLSNDYIELAKEKYSSLNTFYEVGDMRKIPYENHFDAVVNLFTSFGFFKEDEENIQVIKEIHKTLKPNGKFLLDYENKFYFIYNDVFQHEKEWKKIDSQVNVLLENKYDVINEREIFSAKFYKNNKIIDEVGYNIRLYSFPEIKRILEDNGFKILNYWGNYDSNIYSAKSERLILLAQKTY